MANKANQQHERNESAQIANCGSIDAGKVAYRRVAGFFTKR